MPKQQHKYEEVLWVLRCLVWRRPKVEPDIGNWAGKHERLGGTERKKKPMPSWHAQRQRQVVWRASEHSGASDHDWLM